MKQAFDINLIQGVEKSKLIIKSDYSFIKKPETKSSNHEQVEAIVYRFVKDRTHI